jgi:hypothetical protein
MVDTQASIDETQTREFARQWRCTYWFPSNKDGSDEPSAYEMNGYQTGSTVVLESVPNEEGSYMFVRLHIDDDVATGNWHETTSPTGEFKGAIYSGAGQLVVDPESLEMRGEWAGAGFDHDEQKMKIYSGNWEIVPA